MSKISRRALLRNTGAGLAAAGLGSSRIMALAPRVPTPSMDSDRIIVIFLRGAHDAVHTIIPTGDPGLATARASTTHAAFPANPSRAPLPLRGSTYARINPDFQRLVTGPGNPDQAGHAAWIHQCGNASSTRSHFVEQQIYETADVQPLGSLNTEGFLARLQSFAPPGTPIFGASISRAMQRMFRSTRSGRIMAHVKSIRQYDYKASPVGYPGGYPAPNVLNNSESLLKAQLAANHLPFPQPPGIASYLRETAQFAHISENIINSLTVTHDQNAFPTSSVGAGWAGLPLAAQQAALAPGSDLFGFMKRCEEALTIVRNTSCRVVGVESFGWDTHNDQNQRRAGLDPWLALAIHSLYNKTLGGSEDYTILVVSEFGRTSQENTNPAPGTDHGVGGLMMAFGPKVNGGVYNCHGAGGPGLGHRPWRTLTSTAAPQNAQPVAIDFRTIFCELLQKRLGLTNADLATVVPGFTYNNAGGTATNSVLNVFQ